MSKSPLSKNFSMRSLLAYTIPSIFTMVFMSTYTIIDGVFVSRLVGEDALAAVNLIMPLMGIVMAVGLMFATGGNAVIAKFMGEGKTQQAREFLTIIFIIGTILGLICSIVVFAFPHQTLSLLSISESLYSYAYDYMLSLAGFAVPVFFLVFVQSFFITAGKPTLGFILSISGGITNIILDYFFISPNFLDLGIAGAGLATGIGNSVPGVLGFFYFMFHRKGILHFVKPRLKIKTLLQSIFNGTSELIGSLATSITTMLFNFILLNLVGDAGVAAISVILYIQMFQSAIYIGYTIGVSPIISYKYGENNKSALHKIMRQSFIIVGVASALVIVLTLMFSEQAVAIFIAKDSSTFAMAQEGLLMFLPSYIFMGFNLFFSAMFTSLSNGKVSAIISIMRSLLFIVISLLILPQIFGLIGVWIAVPVAEFLSIGISLYFYYKGKKVYGY